MTYKASISRHRAESLVNLIDSMNPAGCHLYEQMIIASLQEISLSLKKKMIEGKTKYKQSFTPCQAIAMCALCGWYHRQDVKLDDMGNWLLKTNNEIFQLYNL